MDYSGYKELLVEKKDYIATLTFNRPDKFNILSATIKEEFNHCLETIAEDDEVRVVILTGAGKTFSAGSDIAGIKARLNEGMNADSAKKIMREAIKVIDLLVNLPQPIIAAVNGDCVTLAGTMALCCDIIIADENARFGDLHVRGGLVAGDGGAVIWPLLLPLVKAKEYLLTGKLFDAKEAERIGLINKAVPTKDFWATVNDMAQQLLANAPQAVRYTKMALNRILRERVHMILDHSIAVEMLTMFSEDHIEGIKSFLEKRKPDWKDR